MSCNPNLSPKIFNPTPDTSVVYTGPDIPALGICNGNILDMIEAIILQQIINYSTGIGIKIPGIDLTACALFTQYITCCTTPTTVNDLDTLMSIIFKSLCVLYTDFTVLQAQVTALLSGPYNTCSLTLGTNPTLSQIIQELILEFCALKTQVATLQTQVNTLSTGLGGTIGTFLLGAIKSCQTGSMVPAGSGATATITFSGFIPVGGYIGYAGTISGIFDSTGLGINPGPACGFALMNGNNGTVDMRGYVPVGVNDGTMGSAAQNPEVTNSTYPGQNYSFNAHGGFINHTLNTSEIPPAGFSGSTTSVSGTATLWKGGRTHATTGDNTLTFQATGFGDAGNSYTISMTVPGQSFSGTIGGGGAAHETRQPYRATYFIQRIF